MNEKEEHERLAEEKRIQLNLVAQQKELNGATFMDKLKEEYNAALNSLNVDVKKLIGDGYEMKGLFLLKENLERIVKVHTVLDSLYHIIYTNQETLKHCKSKRLDQVRYDSQCGFDMIPLRSQSHVSSFGEEFDESIIMVNLKKCGFNKKHWYLKDVLINEIEYLLKVLPLLMEPDFIPFEQNTDDDTTDPNNDRYISKSVKISVWRRDCGKCVECGSQEKLEYDHIIPVAKGGSNTERNVQLLCEQCNRQKSANIQ